ncbi:MAG: DUF421 domain-containing protein [Rhodospirillales bacterium]|nr:DUF421 domain-containing protein [Rhodospirillales bacterium]
MELFNQVFGSGTDGTLTWAQMSARGVLISIYAIVLLRVSARRALGHDTAMDFVVAVIVGSALSRALTGNAALLPTLAAAAVIVGVHSLIAALAVHWGWLSRLAKGRPTRLIEAGKIDWRRARRALIGEGDLEEELRLHGVSGIEAVESAHLERNGRISIVKRSQARP